MLGDVAHVFLTGFHDWIWLPGWERILDLCLLGPRWPDRSVTTVLILDPSAITDQDADSGLNSLL